VEIPAPEGGWDPPWGSVAEIADVLPAEDWTLVGGLMVKAHAALAGLPTTRVTTDVDMVVHLETARGRAARVHRSLTQLGYVLSAPGKLGTLSGDDVAHRYRRGMPGSEDIVDVMRADHVAPTVIEPLAGHEMMAAEGTTQALRRTIDATLHLRGASAPTILSIPDAYGALILKAAAHMVDRRNPGRHLRDAVILLACLEDPFSIEERPAFQSDARRVRHLEAVLADDDNTAWLAVDGQARADSRAALAILCEIAGRRSSVDPAP
jgi:hypothetical protein